MAIKTTGSVKCGFCMTGDHEQCKSEIVYHDKVWHCSCVECHPERGSGKVEETVPED
jgi:hypothetical protein